VSHVFLSYSRRDQAFVDRLIAELERAGLDVWIDRDDIPGGAAWEATISRAVRESAALVVVLSPAAAESDYVPEGAVAGRQHRCRTQFTRVLECVSRQRGRRRDPLPPAGRSRLAAPRVHRRTRGVIAARPLRGHAHRPCRAAG
jgi:TIR domain